MPDLDYVKGRFEHWAYKIWGDTVSRINFTYKLRDQKYLMTVAYKLRPYAIGETLVRFPGEMTIYVSPRLTRKSKENIEKIVIHEVFHIGYSKHTKEFYRLVKKHGGVPSEIALSDERIAVQVKRGSRYKTIRKFKDIEEARSYAELLNRKYKGQKRIRFQY